MNRVFLGLGSNNQPEHHCRLAIKALTNLGKVRVSTAYQSEAVGFEGPSFINLVVELTTALELKILTGELRQLEFELGRSLHAKKHEDRTIDIDILLFNQEVCDDPKLPRDDIERFAFVLKPLFELAPDLPLPGKHGTVGELWYKRQSQLLQQQPLQPILLDN